MNTIGMVSEWLELDSPDDGVRYDAEIVGIPDPMVQRTLIMTNTFSQALKQELSYASYLNLQSVVLPPPRNRQHVADYARAINACLHSTSAYLQISVRMPIYDPRSNTANSITNSQDGDNIPLSVHARAPDGDLSSTWEMWDVIRTICGYNPRLSLSRYTLNHYERNLPQM